jgi:glutamine cyclotransferase
VIVRTLPHDTNAFTQGLAYLNGDLYESSGGQPHSSLRCLDTRDGAIKNEIAIENDFAEGIAIWGSLIYMLSWKSGRARIFDVRDLDLIRVLSYQGEGWGLCSGLSALVKSDGTDTLQFLDHEFGVLRRLRVTVNRFPTRRLNDLEWVDDTIYANVLWSNEILEISARRGRVVRVIDCSTLAAQAASRDIEHTLNGIAYNPNRNTFYITGKCWPLMFEVRLPSSGTPTI